ncbi:MULTISPECIES: hypothetical protein [Paraburkholderia]|nr:MULTISPECIES: hypothetical protein [Paraburkholderia]GJH31336.1 hypothetical protein CBA19CS91_01285 [Paraburkholderia hospita]CAG9255587.1 hypothetical protein PCAR4_40079 [Paraburkholderia caribensis]
MAQSIGRLVEIDDEYLHFLYGPKLEMQRRARMSAPAVASAHGVRTLRPSVSFFPDLFRGLPNNFWETPAHDVGVARPAMLALRCPSNTFAPTGPLDSLTAMVKVRGIYLAVVGQKIWGCDGYEKQ